MFRRAPIHLSKVLHTSVCNRSYKCHHQKCISIILIRHHRTEIMKNSKSLDSKKYYNTCKKWYSSSSVHKSINKEPVLEEIEEQKDLSFYKLENAEHLYRVQKNLRPFLDVCVNSNMKDLAFNSLEYHHKVQETCGTPLNDIRIYNCLLEAFASDGNWSSFENVMMMMFNGNMKLNLQSFVYAIECAHRAGKNEEIHKILEQIKLNGFDINRLFIDCVFVSDQRKVVLQAIRSHIPNFEPMRKKISLRFNCKLLECLDQDIPLDRFYSFLDTNNTHQLKDFVEEQIELERKGYKNINRVICIPNYRAKNAELINVVKELESKWKADMLSSFKAKIEEITVEYARKNGSVDIYPYLCCLKPEEFVNFLFEEFLMITAKSYLFEMELTHLHLNLGAKIMKKYFLHKKMKSGIYEHTMKLYNEYCDYYINPELTSRFTPRQYWELLNEKYSDGPDFEQLNSTWPQPIKKDIGKILFSILQNVISKDLTSLANGTGTVLNLNKNIRPFLTFCTRDSNDRIKSREVKNNPEAGKIFELLNDRKLVVNTSNLPMLSPPIPWNSISSGGVLLNYNYRFKNLIASSHLKKLRETNIQNFYPHFDSLNHTAGCPWIINKQVFNTVIEIYKNWDKKNSDFSHHRKMGKQQEETDKLLMGRRVSEKCEIVIHDLLYKLSIANEYRNKVFWFPHTMDYRGRIYPTSTFFNYYMSDLDRGLLQFAKGEPLGNEGLNWLKIHLINLIGSKKRCTLEERTDYCNELLPDIMDSADNPLNGKKWWQKSSKPWQTLACCIELTSALRSSDPSTYICHFPIHQDGTCNGLQHVAALTRDEDTAKQVNLEPNLFPQDLYDTFANDIEEIRKTDAVAGNIAAQFLGGFINRQFVKMPLIILSQGKNYTSAIWQIERQLQDITGLNNNTSEQLVMAAEYLIEEMEKHFTLKHSRVRDLENWFFNCALCISELHDQPLEWISPIGLPVIQPYFKEGKSISVQKSRFSFEKEVSTKESNRRKQAKSFSPNYVQSLDATHMMLTNLFCQRQGITFVSVHDSFWTYPSAVSEMNKICREQFVALHSEPLLELLVKQLDQQFLVVTDAGLAKQQLRLQTMLSSVPPKGTFDLRKVLQSKYFFG